MNIVFGVGNTAGWLGEIWGAGRTHLVSCCAKNVEEGEGYWIVMAECVSE